MELKIKPLSPKIGQEIPVPFYVPSRISCPLPSLTQWAAS